MNSPRRKRWLFLLGIALLLSAAAGWMALQRRAPKLSFARFADVNGTRHAFFVWENQTDDTFVYVGATASLPVAKFQTADGVMKLIGEPDRNALPFPHALQPGGSIEFSYPLVARDGGNVSEPFQLCVTSTRAGPSLWHLFGDLRFHLPYWLAGPERITSWSEEVTP